MLIIDAIIWLVILFFGWKLLDWLWIKIKSRFAHRKHKQQPRMERQSPEDQNGIIVVEKKPKQDDGKTVVNSEKVYTGENKVVHNEYNL